MNQRHTDIIDHVWESQRPFFDRRVGHANLFGECFAEASPMGLVPGERCGDIGLWQTSERTSAASSAALLDLLNGLAPRVAGIVISLEFGAAGT